MIQKERDRMSSRLNLNLQIKLRNKKQSLLRLFRQAIFENILQDLYI